MTLASLVVELLLGDDFLLAGCPLHVVVVSRCFLRLLHGAEWRDDTIDVPLKQGGAGR